MHVQSFQGAGQGLGWASAGSLVIGWDPNCLRWQRHKSEAGLPGKADSCCHIQKGFLPHLRGINVDGRWRFSWGQECDISTRTISNDQAEIKLRHSLITGDHFLESDTTSWPDGCCWVGYYGASSTHSIIKFPRMSVVRKLHGCDPAALINRYDTPKRFQINLTENPPKYEHHNSGPFFFFLPPPV